MNNKTIKTLHETLYGSVVLSEEPDTHEKVICKWCNKALYEEIKDKKKENPVKEAEILKKIASKVGDKNHNIIKMLRFEEDEHFYCAVLEYAELGDLFGIVSKKQLELDVAWKMFKQMADGVEFLHQNNIVHLDLSLENLFVANGNLVKIGDFGVAQELEVDEETKQVKAFFNMSDEEKKKSPPGKLGYMPPEVLQGKTFDGRLVDVFSLGVCLFSMLFNCPPFYRASSSDTCYRFLTKGDLKTRISKLLLSWNMNERANNNDLDLVSGMLQFDPSKRMTIHDVIAHLNKYRENLGISDDKGEDVLDDESSNTGDDESTIIKDDTSAAIKDVKRVESKDVESVESNDDAKVVTVGDESTAIKVDESKSIEDADSLTVQEEEKD